MSGSDIVDENAAWIRAIRRVPDDEGRRIRYADWLDSHGDRRGEFIRVSLELAKPQVVAQSYAELQARRDYLRASISPVWLLFMGEVVRGVVTRVTVEELLVDVCELEGRVHITDMSWGGHPPDLSSLWSLGQEVEVALNRWDEETTEMSLVIVRQTPTIR